LLLQKRAELHSFMECHLYASIYGKQGIVGLDCLIAQSELWIGQSKVKIEFWFLIVNHIIVMDFDWIDNPKILD
jgi:hypothetical protein